MAKKKANGPGRESSQFKAGNPGGPGRPKSPSELILMRNLTKDEARVILNKFLFWPLTELQAYLKDPSNPVIEYYIAKLIYQGISDGNVAPLNFLFERLLGRVVDKVEVTKPIPTVIELIDDEIGKRIVLGTVDKIENIDLKDIKKETENGSNENFQNES